jgi:DNA-binding GntR family transcriptional regulator
VTEISEQDLDEIFPLMAMLEGRCALEATEAGAARADRPLETIHRQLQRFAASHQVERFFEANQEFHFRIQEMSENRWLRQVIQDLRKVLKLTRMFSLTHRWSLAAVSCRTRGDPRSDQGRRRACARRAPCTITFSPGGRRSARNATARHSRSVDRQCLLRA